MTTPLLAVGYCRVSTASQADHGFSLPEQQAAVAAFCARHSLALLETVTDAGVSGALVNRPGLQRIRDLAEQRAFQVLVCAKLDRLSRKAWFAEQLIEELESRGVRVVFTDQDFGSGPTGDLTRGLLGHVGQFERAVLRARTMDGKRMKARSGRLPGCVRMLGYRQVTKAEAAVIETYAGRDGELEIVEGEAAIVRELFERAAAGEALNALCRWLDGSGIATRRGNPWRRVALVQLLRNSAYQGEFIWGKREQRQVERDGRKQRPSRAAPPEAHIRIPVPAIVPAALWQAVQARLDASRPFPGRPSGYWPLRGCVVCGCCVGKQGKPLACIGHRVTNHRSRPGWERRFYVCSSMARNELTWCGTRADAGELEAEVRRQLLSLTRARPGKVTRLAELARRAAEKAAGVDTGALASGLQAQLTTLEAEIRRLVRQLAKGHAAEIISEELGRLDAQRRGLAAALRAAQAETRSAPQEVERAVEAAAAGLRDDLASGEPERFAAACSRVVRVVVTGEGWEVRIG